MPKSEERESSGLRDLRDFGMRPERAHKMVAKIWKTPARSIVSVYFEQLLTIFALSFLIIAIY